MSYTAPDLDTRPFIVIWETTKACALACVHCRAKAQLEAPPGELTTAEGLALIDEVSHMGTPVMVLSGGDPLMRPDLFELIRHGKRRGLRMGTIPAATPRLTREVVQELKRAGLDQMALSLDASTEAAHDDFRQTPGAFRKTMDAVSWAHEAGIPLQINTVLSAHNVNDLDAIITLVSGLGIVFWEVFFLVPTGRGSALQGLTPAQYEEVFAKLARLAAGASFVIKVTEGLHYRRFLLQQRARMPAVGAHHGLVSEAHREQGGAGRIGLATVTINAGRGHLFISHVGEVYPSGFLPVAVGNVRRNRLGDLYRWSPVFRQLRDPERLKGRCGACEYRVVCGGSRARAWATTGDYLAEEPCCAYEPKAWKSAAMAGAGHAVG